MAASTLLPDDKTDESLLSESPGLLVVAPPGCGKTEFLARRANFLLGHLASGQKILALTFTNRAQANLKERLLRTMGRERARRYVTVRNYHGHATQLILAHGRTIGLNLDTLLLPTTRTMRDALSQASSNYNVRSDAADLLASLKRLPLTDDELMGELENADQRIGRTAAIAVETARRATNQLHYEDLLRHGQRLLRIDEVAWLYQCHYDAVLVDEFQDLSLQQLELVTKSCSRSRTFAGDPLQGIYSWAGAQPAVVLKHLEDACDGVVELRRSYRSAPKVLEMINSVITPLGAATLISAQPELWRDGGLSAALQFKNSEREAEALFKLTRGILGREPSASIGIITRSGWRRTVIDAAFETQSDVPVRRWDLAIDDPEIIDRLKYEISSLPARTTLSHAQETILGRLDPGDVDTRELLEEAFSQLSLSQSVTARGAISALRSRAAEEAIGPGVHLLNAHTGKGQQFDWVFAIGLEERHIPDRRSTAGEALEEELRVLLVMLSRARTGLVVTRVEAQDGPYGSYTAVPSRWWEGLQSAAAADRNELIEYIRSL